MDPPRLRLPRLAKGDKSTKLVNGVECVTGILVHQDIQMDVQTQQSKRYLEPAVASSLPRGEMICQHVPEVLWQEEDSGMEKGGWVGGDAFFGSIGAVVELKARLGIYSSE